MRESGAIEQDADVVMFIYRPNWGKMDLSPEERDQAEIVIAKQRNGPIGDVKLAWVKDFTRFRNASQRPYDEFQQYNESF